MKEFVRMMNVDLFKWGPENIRKETVEEIRQLLSIDLADATLEPEFVAGDMTTTTLPEQSDLITSRNNLQYLDDPLAALCSWYNQLADDGMIIITNRSVFSEWIRTEDGTNIFKNFLDCLGEAGLIARARNINEGTVCRPEFTRMLLIKKPGTTLQLQVKLQRTWTSPDHYKAAYYDSGNRPVRVIAA